MSVLMFHQGAELYGSDKIFYIAVSELVSANKSVTAVISEDGPLRQMLESVGAEVVVQDLGIIRRACVSSVWAFCVWLVKFVTAIFLVRSLIKKNNPELIYVNTLAVMSPLFAKKITFRSGAKVIHHLHEIQMRPKLLALAMYRISLSLSDKVIVVSVAVKEHVLSYAKSKDEVNKVVLLYNGIPSAKKNTVLEGSLQAELRAVGVTNNDLIYAVVGRIHPWKGQLELLDVIGKAKEDLGSSAKFVFFGDVYEGYEWYRERFLARRRELQLDDSVIFFGERRDAESLFHICDVVILPSIKPDPLPTVVLEAMSSGKPVVAYAMGGAVEMIENNVTGILVPVEDKLEFSKSLCLLAEDAAIRRKMGFASEQRFESNFSLGIFRKNLLAMLSL